MMFMLECTLHFQSGVFSFSLHFSVSMLTNPGNYRIQSETVHFLILSSSVLKIDWQAGII